MNLISNQHNLIYVLMEFDNKTIRIAITEYLSDKEKAEELYGSITCWNTSKVTDMSRLFIGAYSFDHFGAYDFDQPLNWDTSNVTNMSEMFSHAYEFNQPLHWNTSKVTNMSNMFCFAISFDQPLNWDTSNVTNMSGMFDVAYSFDKTLYWDTSAIINKSTIPEYVVPTNSFILM